MLVSLAAVAAPAVVDDAVAINANVEPQTVIKEQVLAALVNVAAADADVADVDNWC